MNQFPSHFRQHAIPALRPIVAGQALAVAAGSIEFHEAVRAVWGAARSRGAMFLPDEVFDNGKIHRPFDELCDWILTTLCAEIDRIEDAETNACYGTMAGETSKV